MLFTVAAAHALTIACGSNLSPGEVLPASGAVAPGDARPALVFNDDGCQASTAPWMARLVNAAGEIVPTTLGEGSDDVPATWLIELFPDAALEVGQPYTVEVLQEDELLFSSEFTPSDATVAGIDGEPTLAVDGLWWDTSEGRLSAGLTLTAAADPDGLSVLQVRDSSVDRGIQTVVAPTDGPLHTDASWLDSRKPDEVCLQVRQIDGAGRATDWSDPVCEKARSSCSTVGTGPALGAALLALGLAAGRRRAVRG